ncbi:hypothetical protein BDY19DRAFT_972022 [Irpex rosettiformis]|uniref:Uncharacterized protein n=1 Tax=Irpex rosettiformis TaxID=378272 RepID=A0ACB8TQH7_9APHY|nr:hypothetical protein BDY19DRAFT_972022 [Irpex rosettiformis]
MHTNVEGLSELLAVTNCNGINRPYNRIHSVFYDCSGYLTGISYGFYLHRITVAYSTAKRSYKD